MTPKGRVILGVLVVIALAPAPTGAARALSPPESRGKQIYVDGTSPSDRPIRAYVGRGLIEVPGKAMKCSGCHGEDGRGNPESGVIPSDITWERLTKPYGGATAYGRIHPPYDDATMERAIVSGIDPGGNILDFSMPRYAMEDGDMADLLAYLRRVGAEPAAGITEGMVVVGTVVPRGEGGAGDIAQRVLRAYFADVNAAGGIYGRALDLRTEYRDGNEDVIEAIGRLRAGGEVLALAGVFPGEGVEDLVRYGEKEKIPVVGPLGLQTPGPGLLNRYTFFVLSGIGEQARVLVDFAGELSGDTPSELALITDALRPFATDGGSLGRQLGGREGKTFRVVAVLPGMGDIAEKAGGMAREGVDVLVFLGRPTSFLPLLAEAARVGWYPYVLAPGALVGRDVFNAPAGFRERLFIAYPTLPRDWGDPEKGELEDLREKHRIPETHMAVQAAALAAGKVLVEGLKRGGKAVSAEGLVDALETLSGFETGSTRPVTFGPNRRVGALGAYVLKVDLGGKDLLPAGGWRAPQQ